MTAPREPIAKTERLWVTGAFLAYLVVQIHASIFHGYWGQDWLDHKNWIAFAAEHPWTFITHYAEGRTNPPLFDLLGAAVKHIAGAAHYLIVLGLVNVAGGLVGMACAYGVVRRTIASPTLRIACIIFILFLPFALIHAEVIAADALATPLFWVLLWLVVRVETRTSAGVFGFALALILLVSALGLLTKFTFGSTILAMAAWAMILWRTHVLPLRRFVIMLVVVVALPAALAYHEGVQFRSGQTSSWGIHWPARWAEAEMNPRSVLGLRAADTDIFSAPAYNWKMNGQYPLLLSNRHSFPALLHLAMFTDILNIYQFDPYDEYFGRRTEANHRRMQLAVRTAVIFSALALIGVTTMLARAFASAVIRRQPRGLGILAVLLFSLAWFGNIVGAYPLVSFPYTGGFWLPRLLAPALLGFFIVGFVFLDRLKWRSSSLHVAILIAVIAQSALHASFLWPYRSDEKPYEPNSDIAAASGPVLRVASWQDGYLVNQSGEYWIERALGILIDRPAADAKLERWRLSFTVAPGPSCRGLRGGLRVFSRHFGPEQITFDGQTVIRLEVPVVAGRNDIAVELIDPPPAERADDPKVRMLHVSKIEVWPPGAISPLALWH